MGNMLAQYCAGKVDRRKFDMEVITSPPILANLLFLGREHPVQDL